MDAGLIPKGHVDERDIRDVRPSDLAGYRRCHFFSGLGGWAYALRLAGVPDDFKGLWTGSCPCQPFSAAGRGEGFGDERHLWPAFHWLVSQRHPDVLLGEQVEGPLGRAWLNLVSADLEGIGYAFGAQVLPAAGVGAPHGRHRIFFVADADGSRFQEQRGSVALQRKGTASVASAERPSELGVLVDAASEQAELPGCAREPRGAVGNSDGQRFARRPQPDERPDVPGEQAPRRTDAMRPDFWADCEWVDCVDGKRRPVEPGTFPLAHGVPARVDKLRALGNAIVPQCAAVFIKAAFETIGVRLT